MSFHFIKQTIMCEKSMYTMRVYEELKCFKYRKKYLELDAYGNVHTMYYIFKPESKRLTKYQYINNNLSRAKEFIGEKELETFFKNRVDE